MSWLHEFSFILVIPSTKTDVISNNEDDVLFSCVNVNAEQIMYSLLLPR